MPWVHLQSEHDAKEERNGHNLAYDVEKAECGPKYGLEVSLVQSSIQKISIEALSYLVDTHSRMQIPQWVTALKDCSGHERDCAQESEHETDF